jgi:hypothetical protein
LKQTDEIADNLKSKKGTKRAQDFEVEDLQEAESEEFEREIMEIGELF